MSTEKLPQQTTGHTEGVTLSGKGTVDGWYSGDARKHGGRRCKSGEYRINLSGKRTEFFHGCLSATG